MRLRQWFPPKNERYLDMTVIEKARDARVEFKHIEKHVDSLMRSEAKNPTIDLSNRPKSKRLIAGFEVDDPDIKKSLIAERVSRLKKYTLARAKLLTDLDDLGVEVLASLPVSAWDRICEVSGLFQLPKLTDNALMYNAYDFTRQLRNDGRKETHAFGNKVFMASCVPAYAAAWGVWYAMGVFEQGFTWFGYSVISMMTCAVAAAGAGITTIIATSIHEDGVVRRALTKHRTRTITQLLRHAGQDRNHDDRDYRTTRVVLPTPDAATVEVLLKTETYDQRVALVPEAIQLPDLYEQLNETYKEQKRDEARAAMDPIVYVVRDGVAAIVAQFGDFPVEREIVERLRGEEITL